MFGTTVFNLDDEVFEHPMAEYKASKGYKVDTEMTAEDWQALVATFKAVFTKHVGFDFPQDVYKQLEYAIKAVFESWMGKRAIDYRRATGISDDLYAVNIQTMVFGNTGNDFGTGVAFTRNPSTGDQNMMGEYLFLNAQGEDVVAGYPQRGPDRTSRQ